MRVDEEIVGGLGLAAFAEAVGVATDVHDGGLVQQTIEGGPGHDGVAGEDVGPFGEGFVGGEDDGSAGVVALADDLEQQRGLGLIEGEVADFVDDEELGPGEVVHLAVEFVFGEGFSEPAGGFDGAGEVNAVAQFRAGDTEADGEMGFPHAGWAEENDVTAFGEVAAGGKFVEELGVDGGLGLEVEVGQAFHDGEPGELEVQRDGAVVAFGEFVIEQTAEEVAVAPLAGGGLLGDLVESVASGGETELDEAGLGFGFVDRGAHEAAPSTRSGL